MKETKNNNYEGESPQQALEKILQAEIEVAEKITTAKEYAEKRVEAARDEIASLKNNIIEQARRDREEILAKGIAVAKEEAQKRIDQERIESDAFENTGKNFIQEAALRIETIILGEFKSEEE